jgi:CubicO group peptidase (beta-lactamase class C family)
MAPLRGEESTLQELEDAMHRSNGKTHRRVFRLIVLVWVIGCLGVAPSFAGTVYPTAMGWRTSTPEAQGIKSGVLADMLEKIEAGGYAIQSITVIRHGAMVLDTYFFPFEKREKHIIHSCTKSIMSALVGIAIDKGYIKGVNQKVLDFFPDKRVANLDDRKKAITLQDLLTMASGLKCRDS